MSIGIGMDTSYEELLQYASLATEMALSRGGDQAVIKDRNNFEFYGGRGAEVDRAPHQGQEPGGGQRSGRS